MIIDMSKIEPTDVFNGKAKVVKASSDGKTKKTTEKEQLCQK